MDLSTPEGLFDRLDELAGAPVTGEAGEIVSLKVRVAELEAQIEKLKKNQRPEWSRTCGACGWEQIKVSGEWKCGVCEKKQEIDGLGEKFGKQMADLRMRLTKDSRERIAELKAGLRPFAKFACDQPCVCHNCKARELLERTP